jgi:hypothetical protein|tara:strand:- start:137 stop:283 length:147 start_codon:yes stop_codon:yes gene_type:complete
MKALGDKRPDEKTNSDKKRRVGFAPGSRTQPAAQNPPAQENFGENVEL